MSEEELYDNHKPLLLNVGHNIMAKGSVLKKLGGPFSRIMYIVDGEGRIIHNNSTIRLKKNHLYRILPYNEVDFVVDSNLELFYYHVYADSLSYHSLLEAYQFNMEVEAIPLDRLLIERMLEINPGKEIKDNRYDLLPNKTGVSRKTAKKKSANFFVNFETEGIIRQLFTRFMTPEKKPVIIIDPRIRKAIKYVHDNIESTINEDKLADIASMSKDYFIRLFKKELKNTPCKYINEKKIEWAQMQMLVTDISVKDLAERLGYSDTSYFIRIFTKIVGKTPHKYRSSDL